MSIRMPRPELFPDDTNELPTSGSDEQARLIADEELIASEQYLETVETFNEAAGEFYVEMGQHAVSALRAVGHPLRNLRILDLCSGVGLEMISLFRHDIHASLVTLVDVSSATLAKADVFLRKQPEFSKIDRLETIRVDLLEDDLHEKCSGPYDLVLTCNGFIHFPKAVHQQLFSRTHDLLADRGIFLFASHFRLLRKDWKQTIIGDMQARMLAHGSSQELADIAGHHLANFHHYHPLYEVYNWMEAAGYSYFDTAYRKDILGIVVAIR